MSQPHLTGYRLSRARVYEEIRHSPDHSCTILPRPACGGREARAPGRHEIEGRFHLWWGTRGESHPESTSRHADFRKRSEVTERAANSFTVRKRDSRQRSEHYPPCSSQGQALDARFPHGACPWAEGAWHDEKARITYADLTTGSRAASSSSSSGRGETHGRA